MNVDTAGGTAVGTFGPRQLTSRQVNAPDRRHLVAANILQDRRTSSVVDLDAPKPVAARTGCPARQKFDLCTLDPVLHTDLRPVAEAGPAPTSGDE